MTHLLRKYAVFDKHLSFKSTFTSVNNCPYLILNSMPVIVSREKNVPIKLELFVACAIGDELFELLVH